MGCAQANSTEVVKDQNNANRYRIHSIRHHKNVNPDQITEEIEVVSSKLTEEQIHFAVLKLSDHQLFGTLNKRELKVIAQEMVLVKPKDPEGYVFKQGDVGTCFFLIFEGEVDA